MDGTSINFPQHRVSADTQRSVCEGRVRWSPVKSLWLLGHLAGALVGGWLTYRLSAFLLFIVLTVIVLLFGHSLGSHRRLVHHSFDCPRWLEFVLIYCGVQVGLAGPIGLLRQHELRDFAQRLPDCHPYLRHGMPAWHDAWWQLNCELVLDHPPRIRLESRVAEDRVLAWLERTWMLQHLLLALALFAIGGWAFVWWGACARATAGIVGHWFIGYLAHNHGQMHHQVVGAAVQGRNVRFTSLLTMGECWHNNHHAYPGSARLGLKPGEWDPGWWVLRAFERMGWVWNLRLPQHLPLRPELVRCPPSPTCRIVRWRAARQM
jgi:stearoyl-CoA desaturase (delta-9 desaturase)